MAIKTAEYRRPEIDLRGTDGNAFFLLGTAAELCKQFGLDRRTVCAEMRSGDYENLIQTFDKYFGEVVDLIR